MVVQMNGLGQGLFKVYIYINTFFSLPFCGNYTGGLPLLQDRKMLNGVTQQGSSIPGSVGALHLHSIFRSLQNKMGIWDLYRNFAHP